MLEPVLFPIDRIVDTEGRPLREHAAPAELLEGVPMELVTCMYPGSRHKHKNPMNVSALRQMTGHWDKVVEISQFLRGLYQTPPQGTRLIDLWRIGYIGECLPQYLVYRAEQSIPAAGHLEPYLAGLYKIVIGLNDSLRHLAEISLVKKSESEFEKSLELEELYQYIEDNKLLIGPKQVCAGPENLIKKVVKILISAPQANVKVDQQYQTLIGDIQQYLGFCWCIANAKILSLLFIDLTNGLSRCLATELYPTELMQTSASHWSNQSESSIFLNATYQFQHDRLKFVLDSLMYHQYPGGDKFREKVTEVVHIFETHDYPEKLIASKIKEALIKERKFEPKTMAVIVKYLALELLFEQLSSTLKQQYLSALGLNTSAHLTTMIGKFYPPSQKMRSVMLAEFGISLDTDLLLSINSRPISLLSSKKPQSSACPVNH